ncbi:S8 family serine peptidase [Mucilaginibacter arboris]|uniref:S8 family serine peptidase n=1 Tax=Mucilaginibacter arboris TaxID=2682090 RepID=A0A7K1SSX6_9SPHI|nr:S8 family serine peptidase [Mucilaginibacter arboris]MVN20200.1 S8 family serine peptidase [Mucilaginibacter arboris]
MKINLKTTVVAAVALFAINYTVAVAQQVPAKLPADLPKNWHTLDLKKDGYFGVSLNQAYDFLKGKKSKTVIVATIDSGVDTLQKDLQPILWVNTKEKAGNGKDDDNNGYTDDIHGWNFLGGPNNKCDVNETTEEVREYYRLKDKYATVTATAAAKDKAEYAYWLKVKGIRDSTVSKSQAELDQLTPLMNALVTTDAFIKKSLSLKASQSFTKSDLTKLEAKNDTLIKSKYIWGLILQDGESGKTDTKTITELNEYITKLNNDVNPDLEARKRVVGDNPNDINDKKYGNNQLKFEDASHGTGVAGLIGAVRNNGYGIDGIADNVRIMAIKAVPNGDEYDKDIANAIRYAVDNGAKVVNMSFGKKISPHKKWVDDAMKYAAEKDVLLVQASGNDNQDVDVKPEFPNDTFLDGSTVDNVISVGASGSLNDETLAASFSNYGKKNVDVFAPGVKVTSIDKDAEFNTADGTSFASPITAGIAALVLEYYPTLSAKQLKEVIIASAKPLQGMQVLKPGSKEKVDFTTLSKSGGVVNALEALKAASVMKGERKK